MDCISGITYYGLESQYIGDVTKNCGLSANEIDCNFHYLRGKEIADFYWDGDESLFVIELLDGTKIETDSVDKYINDSIEAMLSGITESIEEIDCELSGLSESIEAVYDEIDTRFSGITEEINSFKGEVNDELEDMYTRLITTYNEGISLVDDRIDELERQISGVTGTVYIIRDNLTTQMMNLEINTNNSISTLAGRIEQYKYDLNQRIDAMSGGTENRLVDIDCRLDHIEQDIEDLQNGLETTNLNLSQLSAATINNVEIINERIDQVLTGMTVIDQSLHITGSDVEIF